MLTIFIGILAIQQDILPPDLNEPPKVRTSIAIKVIKGSRLFVEVADGKWKQFGKEQEGPIISLHTPPMPKGNAFYYKFMAIYEDKRLIKILKFKAGESKTMDFTDFKKADIMKPPSVPANP